MFVLLFVCPHNKFPVFAKLEEKLANTWNYFWDTLIRKYVLPSLPSFRSSIECLNYQPFNQHSSHWRSKTIEQEDCADLVDLEVLSDHLVLGLVWLPHAQASWIYWLDRVWYETVLLVSSEGYPGDDGIYWGHGLFWPLGIYGSCPCPTCKIEETRKTSKWLSIWARAWATGI